MIFSIIIPAYNAERYLKESLNSVKEQEFQDFEVIVVDDGSEDSTGVIAEQFARETGNATVLHGSNQGLLLARRRGLSAASGEYVVFLDADDMLRSDALGVIAAAIADYGADIVSFEMTRRHGFSASDSASPLSAGLYAGTRFGDVREHVCRGRFNSLWGKAIRLCRIDTDAVYGAYAGLMHGEDLLQLLPIVDRSSSLVHLSDVLYYYRPSDQSSTATYRPSQLADIVRVNARLREFAHSWGGRCVDAAAVGEAKQYIYLLKMSETSRASRTEKDGNYQAIREAMAEEGVFDRCFSVPQRIDDRIVLSALRRNRKRLARWTIDAVETVKRAV